MTPIDKDKFLNEAVVVFRDHLKTMIDNDYGGCGFKVDYGDVAYSVIIEKIDPLDKVK